MDLGRKYELTKLNIDSLADHSDADATTRKNGLDAVIAYCAEKKAEIDAEVAADSAAAFGKTGA